MKVSRVASVVAVLCLFLSAALLGSGWAAAQQSGSITIPSMRPDELYIRNATGQTMLFYAAVDDSEFASYSVEPNHSITISCQGAGCGGMQYFHIKINSNVDGRLISKEYSEKPGVRVQIAWNNAGRHWDFFKDN